MIKKVVATVAATGGLVLAGAGIATAHSGAQGAAVDSPGILSGNVVQAPIHVPLNVCGNTISILGLLNPAFGNSCVNK
ncbi:chaplin [Streptomyces polyrhachis]|uniref:Chaplin n=1 Tax=Streptomyces polyrhachis TaxID=1282885 RepID=A0ABW2GHB1_9ACTN